MPRVPLTRALLSELALWLFAAAIFVIAYVSEPQVAAIGAAAHLAVVSLVWLGLTLVRMVLVMIVSDRSLARAMCALAVAAGVVIVVAYDILVIAGMHLWGGVVSWELMRAYALQAPALAQMFGVQLYAPALAAGGVLVAAYAVVWRSLGRFDWVAHLARAVPSRTYVGIVIAVAVASTAGLTVFRTGRGADFDEPLSLTFYPGRTSWHLQGHGIDHRRARQLDAREDEARAAYKPDASPDRKNLVLIVVDALRPDHMGVYGYERDTTPYLSAVARSRPVRAVPQVRSTCGSSACGMLSLISSKFAHQFSERPITLHEVLKRHGYRLHLVIGSDHTNFYGLNRMYGAVDSYYDTSREPVAYMNDDRLVLARAAALPRWDGAPVMLQFHLMSAHPLGARQDRYATYAPAASYVVPGARSAALARNYYDNGVRQVDAVIESLLATLRAKGYLGHTLIAITGDHGEALGERGRYMHARGLDDEALRIPLLLIGEGYEPGRLALDASAIASQVDVAPTVLRELGIPQPATWSGYALQDGRRHDFIYLREFDAIGLIDQRDPRNLWQYWVDGKSGREHIAKLGRGTLESEDAIDGIPAVLLNDWRRRHLQLAALATTVPREP
ncbi:MAG TPA: sulfatase-like hydrolase/transferase [Burkholderiales bacterium]|nr:sulfatase-like hydrolase/transferase [Burkholderiales bacterium]